jgi:hypothetical protein
MRSFWGLLVWSALLAGLSSLIPFLYRKLDFDLVLLVSSFCSVLWLAVVLYALRTVGRRGRWLLLGLPLCLLWPLSTLLVWLSCRLGLDCI